eukprot:jgi/Ulvmu1/4921/UM202_0006.1
MMRCLLQAFQWALPQWTATALRHRFFNADQARTRFRTAESQTASSRMRLCSPVQTLSLTVLNRPGPKASSASEAASVRPATPSTLASLRSFTSRSGVRSALAPTEEA